jgi:hypothetical protein
MECKSNACKVVLDMKYDYEKDKVLELKKQWIDRSKLKGESHFGAADSHGDGYCTNGKMIEDFMIQ